MPSCGVPSGQVKIPPATYAAVDAVARHMQQNCKAQFPIKRHQRCLASGRCLASNRCTEWSTPD